MYEQQVDLMGGVIHRLIFYLILLNLQQVLTKHSGVILFVCFHCSFFSCLQCFLNFPINQT